MVHELFGSGPGGHYTIIVAVAAVFGLGWLALRFMSGSGLRSAVIQSAIVTAVVAGLVQFYVGFLL